MNGCDLMEEVARLREDRDRLLDEARDIMRERDELRMVLDDEQAHCEEFKAELKRAIIERDQLRIDLCQARRYAEEMRDLYAAEIDESVAVIPFPWEEDNDAGRQGR